MLPVFPAFREAHDPVHDLRIKTNYSEPKIYAGRLSFPVEQIVKTR